LSKRSHTFRVRDLTRQLVYLLGHRPDEFGVVPGEDGFLPYKALLQALHDQEGWGYVRQSHVQEVLLGPGRDLFDADERGIRARDRRWRAPAPAALDGLPKLLFAAVRPRAHPVVMEKGLGAAGGERPALSADRETALRLGRRRDPRPVVLEIAARRASESGVPFHSFGDLYLAGALPPEFLSGPPLPPPQEEKPRLPGGAKEPRLPDPEAGSFRLAWGREAGSKPRAKGRQPKGWKEQARKDRRGKRAP
jgi:putative RNA 2'-phosphotransferase